MLKKITADHADGSNTIEFDADLSRQVQTYFEGQRRLQGELQRNILAALHGHNGLDARAAVTGVLHTLLPGSTINLAGHRTSIVEVAEHLEQHARDDWTELQECSCRCSA